MCRGPATDVLYSPDHSKSKEAEAADLIKKSILVQDNNLLGLAKIGSTLKEESGNELAFRDCKKTVLTHNVSLEQGHPCEGASSVVPPASTCTSNVESGKPSIDVVGENLMESQSSSTPSCPLTFPDEETDERCKELLWLEDLNRVLQDKKNRETCSGTEQVGTNCAEASERRASPMILGKSSMHTTWDQVSI